MDDCIVIACAFDGYYEFNSYHLLLDDNIMCPRILAFVNHACTVCRIDMSMYILMISLFANPPIG
jgi:translation elongation factor EF-Tu-like GTPase